MTLTNAEKPARLSAISSDKGIVVTFAVVS
jgi:hypothetical protein